MLHSVQRLHWVDKQGRQTDCFCTFGSGSDKELVDAAVTVLHSAQSAEQTADVLVLETDVAALNAYAWHAPVALAISCGKAFQTQPQ